MKILEYSITINLFQAEKDEFLRIIPELSNSEKFIFPEQDSRRLTLITDFCLTDIISTEESVVLAVEKTDKENEFILTYRNNTCYPENVILSKKLMPSAEEMKEIS